MKKSVTIIALAFGVSNAFAQDLTSKKGEPILPEAGDWAISVNADPIFEFVGNAFSGYTGKNGVPAVSFLNANQTIVGKKFIDEKNAYRVLVRLGFNNESYKNLVNSDANIAIPVFPAQWPQVEDKVSRKNTNIAIGAGKEMRRGKTRLQGYYGADAMIWISMASEKHTWGNTMSATNASGTTTTPTSTVWNADGTVASESPLAVRELKSKSGMTLGIGARGFIGAEYFIFPKISIGAEFGWGIGYQMNGKGKLTAQTVGGTTPTVGEVEVITAGSSKFGFDTDLNQGTIFGFKGSNTGTSACFKLTAHF